MRLQPTSTGTLGAGHHRVHPAGAPARPERRFVPLDGAGMIVDSTKIATKLDVHATPLDQALADTLVSYQSRTSEG